MEPVTKVARGLPGRCVGGRLSQAELAAAAAAHGATKLRVLDGPPAQR